MTVRELGEFGLLDALGVAGGRLPAGWLGPGDDAAVLPPPGLPLLFTSDLLAEGVHFRRSTTSPRDLGWKALAVNVSDVAAMGGRPLGWTVSLACPGDLDEVWLQELYAGFREASEAFGCPLVGGDTSGAPLVFLSVALLGVAPAAGAVRRDGARTGDDLYVSGALGESALGLHLLERGADAGTPARAALVRRHRRPAPRCALGAALGAAGLASALIDVSDGLVQDLGHVLRRSGAGALLDADALPLSAALRQVAGELGLDAAALALGGGEDYELLFAASPERAAEVEAAAAATGTPVARVGRVDAEPGLRLVRGGAPWAGPAASGWDHFRAAEGGPP